MPHFDIFNADADGMCAIQQIRLNNPQESTLVTGVKRGTLLLKNVISVKIVSSQFWIFLLMPIETLYYNC